MPNLVQPVRLTRRSGQNGGVSEGWALLTPCEQAEHHSQEKQPARCQRLTQRINQRARRVEIAQHKGEVEAAGQTRDAIGGAGRAPGQADAAGQKRPAPQQEKR